MYIAGVTDASDDRFELDGDAKISKPTTKSTYGPLQ